MAQNFLLNLLLLQFLAIKVFSQTPEILSLHIGDRASSDPDLVAQVKSLTLQFTGVNFKEDPFQVSVLLDDSIQCKVEPLSFSSTYFRCVIDEQDYLTTGVKLISVKIDNNDVSCSDCQFTVTDTCNFVIDSIFPTETVPGGVIKIFGHFRENTVQNIYEVRLGDFFCVFDVETFGDDLNEFDKTYIECSVPPTIPHGEYEIKVFDTYNENIAFTSMGLRNYNQDMETFHLRVIPRVAWMNTNQGSPSGLTLHVRTNYESLDAEDLSVSLGFEECKVSKVKSNLVKCALPRETVRSKKLFPGGVGLVDNTFNESPSGDISTEKIYITVPKFIYSSDTKFTKEISTVFCSRHSGYYSFVIETSGMTIKDAQISTNRLDYETPKEKLDMTSLCTTTKISDHFDHNFFDRNCIVLLKKSRCRFIKITLESTEENTQFNLGMILNDAHDVGFPQPSPIKTFKMNFHYSDIYEAYEISIDPDFGGEFNLVVEVYDLKDDSNKLNKIIVENIPFDIDAPSFEKKLNDFLSRRVSILLATPKANTNKIYTIDFKDAALFKYVISIQVLKISQKGQVTIQKTREQSYPPVGSARLKVNDLFLDIQFAETSTSIQEKLSALGLLQNEVQVITTLSKQNKYHIFLRFNSPDFIVTIESNSITGGTNVMDEIEIVLKDVTDEYQSKIYFKTIPSDYLRTWSSTPEVTVNKSGEYFFCASEVCEFEYFQGDFPEIENVVLNNNFFGFHVDYSGDNDGIQEAVNKSRNYQILGFNGACSIQTFSNDNIWCSLKTNPDNSIQKEAGVNFSLKVELLDFGFLESDEKPVNLVPTIKEIVPSRGSSAGGNLVQIRGTHFKINPHTVLKVRVGDNDAEIISFTNTIIEVIVPSNTAAFHSNTGASNTNIGASNTNIGPLITLEFDEDSYTFQNVYNYDESLDIQAISVDDSLLSFWEDWTLTLTGNFMGFSIEEIEVSTSRKPLLEVSQTQLVTGVNDDTISVNMRNINNDNYLLNLVNFRVGRNKDDLDMNYKNQILFNQTAELQGSSMGGKTFKFLISHFPTNPDHVQIFIKSIFIKCKVVNLSPTWLKVQVPFYEFKMHTDLEFQVILKYREIIKDTNLIFRKSDDMTPVVYSVEPLRGSLGDVIVIMGDNFTEHTLNEIKFGEVPALMNMISPTEIQVIVPDFAASVVSLSLLIYEHGYPEFE